MARQINRLSARAVSTIKKPGRHADGAGLYLSISPSKPSSSAFGEKEDGGGRRWVFIFKRCGKSREMGLGSVKTVSLALARDLAEDARALISRGLDPITARQETARAAAAGLPFKQCAARYIEANKAGWRNAKHAAQWEATLALYAYPVIGDLSVTAVGVGEVMTILEPIWARKTETASRVRGRVETVLDWARARGFRQGENPARWRGHLDKLLPARSKVRRVRHHPALPYAELPAFMIKLREREGVAPLALEFTILTAARTGAVTGAAIAEFDVTNKVWSVPPERAGTKIVGDKPEPRRVPLSPRALEIVQAMMALHGPGVDPSTALFPGSRPDGGLSNAAMLAVLDRMGRGDITVHGFRSSFKDWCAEATNYAGEVSEAALWHAVADKVEAAYRRGDLFKKRTALMSAWAAYCANPRAASVIPLTGRAQAG